jgi:ABC-2 type transport system ATP-binding protein
MRDELLEQVRVARSQGQAVLFSSHVLSEVEQVCDRVAVLRGGRLVHLQTMAELREGRLIRATLNGRWQADEALPTGLRVREYEKDQLTLEYHGPLPALMAWLARQPLADLRLEPLGLASIYYRYHRADA